MTLHIVAVRLMKIKQWVDEHDPRGVIIPWSAAMEGSLVEMGSDEERVAYLKERGTTR